MKVSILKESKTSAERPSTLENLKNKTNGNEDKRFLPY